MAAALAPLYATAAIVLALAGAAKLRAPATAAQALRKLGLPAGQAAVRAIAAAEIVIACAALLRPSPITAALLAVCYLVFAATSALLANSHTACGCFGQSDTPASLIQSVLSMVIAILVCAAALTGPRGLQWLAGHDPASAAVLAIGIAGCAYGIVLAYRELPHAWSAWSSP